MPSTLIWTGAIDGDFAKAGNYIDQSTGTAPGSPPDDGDTLIYDRGSVDVDTGLTTGKTGLIVIGTDGYKGRIAPGSGDALSATFASIRWGAGYLSLTGNITDAAIECRAGAKFHYAGGTATDLFFKCDATIAAAAVVTNIRARGRYMIDALHNGTGFALAILKGGARLHTKRSGLFDIHAGSTVETLDAAAISTNSVIRTGGRLFDRSSANVPGNLQVEDNGIYDPTQANTTKSINQLIVWENARYNLFTKAGPVVLTNPIRVFGLSPLSSNEFGGGPIPL